MTDEPFWKPNLKPPPLRQPQPGELLLTFESGQDVYRCELRDQDPHGLDCQWFLNGELLQTCRFTVRAPCGSVG